MEFAFLTNCLLSKYNSYVTVLHSYISSLAQDRRMSLLYQKNGSLTFNNKNAHQNRSQYSLSCVLPCALLVFSFFIQYKRFYSRKIQFHLFFFLIAIIVTKKKLFYFLHISYRNRLLFDKFIYAVFLKFIKIYKIISCYKVTNIL